MSARSEEFATVTWKERLSFGGGDLATNIAWGALATYVVFFYTNVIGAAASAVGTIVLIARLFDGVVDVGMGAIVDRTSTRWGKARPWVLWAAAPFAVALILVFTVPGMEPAPTLVYIAITYALMNIALSAAVIPYGTLNTRMTRDFTERSRLNVTRMFGATLGSLVVTVLTLPLVSALGDDQRAWIITFCLFGAVAAVLFFITFRNTRERIVDTAPPKDQPGIVESLKLAGRNRYWLLLFAIFIVFSVAESLYTGATAYFAQYFLGDAGFAALMSFMLYIPALLGMLFMQPVYQRFGKVAPMIMRRRDLRGGVGDHRRRPDGHDAGGHRFDSPRHRADPDLRRDLGHAPRHHRVRRVEKRPCGWKVCCTAREAWARNSATASVRRCWAGSWARRATTA